MAEPKAHQQTPTTTTPRPSDTHPLSTAEVTEARVAYTARILREGDECETRDEWRALVRASLLSEEGSRLLGLAVATSEDMQDPIFTVLLDYDAEVAACDDECMRAIADSIERFGFPCDLTWPPDSRNILNFFAFRAASLVSRRLVSMVEVVHLFEVVLAQPTCTRDIVSAPSRGGKSCLQVLWSTPTMEWLPLALMLQRRHHPLSWENWINSGYHQVEAILRFLLADPSWLEVATQDRASQRIALKRAEIYLEQAPRHTPYRLIHAIVRKLESASRSRVAASLVDASSTASITEFRIWLEQQLADLPTQLLSANLRDQLMTKGDDSGVAALVRALEQQPNAVRLDESSTGLDHETLIAAVIARKDWRLLFQSGVTETFFQRVAAMAPGPSHSVRYLVGLAEEASLEEPGGVLERLLVALIDGPLIGPSPEAAHSFVRGWFAHISPINFVIHPAPGVRRILDLLALRGFTLDQLGNEFETYISTTNHHMRNWLATHEGTDWCTVAHRAQRRFERPSHDNSGALLNFGPLPDEVAAQLQEWTTRHWPAVRGELEQHLIPDLAAIAFGYLQPPPPPPPRQS